MQAIERKSDRTVALEQNALGLIDDGKGPAIIGGCIGSGERGGDMHPHHTVRPPYANGDLAGLGIQQLELIPLHRLVQQRNGNGRQHQNNRQDRQCLGQQDAAGQ